MATTVDARAGRGVAWRRPRVSVLTGLGGLIVVYLALPLGAFLVRLVTSDQRGFAVPGLYPSLWTSVSCATISLAIVTLFGVPLAFVLARSRSRLATIVGVIVQIPLALPPLMSGIVLIYVIGPYTFLGRLFHRDLTNSRTGIIIAMTFVAAPFLIVAARAAFSTLDQGLLDVAHTLGHADVSRFVRVAVPIAGPSIRAGMLLTWLRAFGEYGAVVVLAFNPTSLPIYTYNQFSGTGLPTTLAPTALAMGVAVVAVAISRVSPSKRRGATSPPAPISPPALAPQSVAFCAHHKVGTFEVNLAHPAVGHLAILGPSGSGKSLSLRSLAGLAGESELSCNGLSLTSTRVSERPVGYVAQGFSLFPHLSVWQHLLFGRRATPELAAYWCGHLQLGGLESRRPAELSGGQRQRVALAQALCNSPHVLLLDEPFSALDAPVRAEMQRLLRRLQRETQLATVLVTHDSSEAALLSEDIVVLSEGREVQSGSVRDVFSRPVSAHAARLLGMVNLFEAVVVSETLLDVDGVTVAVATTSVPIGSRVTCSVRPDDLRLHPHAGGKSLANEPTLRAKITDIADVGTAYLVFVSVGTTELQARSEEVNGLVIGEECVVTFAHAKVHLWPTALDNDEGLQMTRGTHH
ncbi:MAG TPA: ATP-binding cassette domain-containing protein [Acidimicrobiales bacterium]